MNRPSRWSHRGVQRFFVIVVALLCTAGVAGGAVAIAAAGSTPRPLGLFSSTDKLPPEKSAELARMQAARDSAAATPLPEPSFVPPTSPQPSRVSMISDAHQSPLGGGVFATSNIWDGPSPVAGEWLVVFAGASTTDANKGPAVLVFAEAADTNAPDQYFKEVGVYTDSAAAGPLSVVSADKTGLTLAADATSAGGVAGGKTSVTFDLSTHTFG